MTTKISASEWNRMVDEALEHRAKIVGRQNPVEWRAVPSVRWSGIRQKYITADMIRRYAWAIGDPNPLWSDPNYARNTKWGGIIAPPTFEDCVSGPHAIKDPLRMLGFHLFDRGAIREYFTVLRPGDQIVYGIDTYQGITEETKPDMTYRLFWERTLREHFNQRGEKIWSVIAGGLMVGVPPGKEKEYQQQVSGGITKPHYSQEQLAALHAHYEEQLEGKWRRGADTRYWEDVTEGEEIPPVIRGPLDDTDIRSFMGGAFGFASSFALNWHTVKSGREVLEFADPETGAYLGDWYWHASDAEAQRRGMAYAVGEGKQNQTAVSHAITNWMGDDGFVKKLTLNILDADWIAYHGDMAWAKGRVIKKYIDESEYLVDLEVWSENQRNQLHTHGSATILLPSRK